MAFWGVELKPGNPYKHRYNDARGRLHISQATLGSGQAATKSITVQCNVGDKCPVLLCSLLPGKSESCPLNLEFEEEEEVIFSVIGPKSVHLTGFYLGPSRDFNRHGGDSDSYGEDIAETETDQSSDYNTEDDKYEEDFIDDGDLEIVHSSSRRKSKVTIEEIVDNEKPANGTCTTKRLKKKYQLSDSDSGDSSQQQIVGKSSRTLVLDTEDDDGFPVSTTSEGKCIETNADSEDKSYKTTEDGMKEKTKNDGSQGACLKRKIDAINQDGKCDRVAEQLNHLSDSFARSDEIAAENGGNLKKKKKEKRKKEKFLQTEEKAGGDEATTGCRSDVPDNFKIDIQEEKIVNKSQDLPVSDALKEKLSIDKKMIDSTDPSDTIAPERILKPKKIKGRAKDKSLQPEVGAAAETEVKACDDDDSKPPNTEATVEAMDQDPSVNAQEPNAKPLDDKEVTDSTVPLDTIAPESIGKIKKKKVRTTDKTLQPEVGPSAETEVKACGDNDSKQLNDEATIEAMDQDPSVNAQEPNANLLDDKTLDDNVDPAGADGQKKKKTKKGKTHQDIKSASVEESGLAVEETKSELVEKIHEQQDLAHPSEARTLPNGLDIKELSTGKPDGKRADPGYKVSIHYIGKLKKNGETFDSSTGRKPLKFRLGKGEVIEGLDAGVVGMCIGDKRRLTIPPSMGYGAQGRGEIPENAWLVFDVELVDVR